MVERSYPSLAGAQYESVRLQVDARFLDEARRLDDSYTGTALAFDSEGGSTNRAPDGWKHGVSHPFVSGAFTYDKQPTLDESKVLFDKLYGLIWQHHQVALVDQNITDGLPYPTMDDDRHFQQQPREPQDAGDLVRFKRTIGSKKATALGMIQDLRNEGIEIAVT